VKIHVRGAPPRSGEVPGPQKMPGIHFERTPGSFLTGQSVSVDAGPTEDQGGGGRGPGRAQVFSRGLKTCKVCFGRRSPRTGLYIGLRDQCFAQVDVRCKPRRSKVGDPGCPYRPEALGKTGLKTSSRTAVNYPEQKRQARTRPCWAYGRPVDSYTPEFLPGT